MDLSPPHQPASAARPETDKKGEGHAVLTVKSDKGEFILDNQNESVVAWTETGYRFVKRQSQSDPNVWVAMGDTHPAVATASAR